MAPPPFALCRYNIFACLFCRNDSKYTSLTQRHSPTFLSHTRTHTLRFHSTTHADFFRRSKQQHGGAVYAYATMSSFTACTFENNEAQVRLCLTNKRLLKRTHTSIRFLSLMLLLLLVLLLSHSIVMMAMLARLTSFTYGDDGGIGVCLARDATSSSFLWKTNEPSLDGDDSLIGSLGLRCCLDQAALLSWAFTCECRRRL